MEGGRRSKKPLHNFLKLTGARARNVELDEWIAGESNNEENNVKKLVIVDRFLPRWCRRRRLRRRPVVNLRLALHTGTERQRKNSLHS